MKAILHTRYGSPDLLELKEVEKPTPGENQVLIKVRAASINALEYRMMTGQALLHPPDGRRVSTAERPALWD